MIFAVLARPLIKLFYGDLFLPSFTPFLILLPGVFYLWTNNILTNYLVGMKRFLVISFIACIASIFNIFLNLIFIPRYGAQGAALASTITYVIIGTLTIVAFLRTSKYKLTKFIKELAFNRSDLMLYPLFQAVSQPPVCTGRLQ